MDVALFLQRFESSLTSYTGDDPLEQWDRFVKHLEQRLPADGCAEMSLVFETLVQRFLSVERYANDVRYVNYCIRYAGFHSDPVSLYNYFFGQGIGTRAAVLYVAWAQQCEQRGMNERADAVYQKALENQAQPADMVLQEYRNFQTRSTEQASAPGSRNPLQNLNLANQPVAQNKASVDCPSKPPARKMTLIVSRSETSATVRSGPASSGAQVVPEYMTEELLCEGSELCFEEVRAAKYFQKLREQQEAVQRKIDSEHTGDLRFQHFLESLGRHKVGEDPSHASSRRPVQPAVETTSDLHPAHPLSARPRPSARRSFGLRLLTEPAFMQEAAAPSPPSPASTPADDDGMDGGPAEQPEMMLRPDRRDVFHRDAVAFQDDVTHQ
ncbi:unnamed protein product [Ophioblennius macclurei]